MKKLILVAGLILGLSQTGLPLQAAEFTNMFNGTDLTGWEGATNLWSVKDGEIIGQTSPESPAKENTFLIYTNNNPADFEMHCMFRISPQSKEGFANSGIQYRSRVVKPSYWVVAGYQADMEAGPNYTGQLYEEKGRGFLAMRGQKTVIHPDGKKDIVGSFGTLEELGKEIHKGDWNEYVIIAQGDHLQQFINGKQMIDVVDDQKGRAATYGVIALQLHAGPPMKVEYKDLRLKELK